MIQQICTKCAGCGIVTVWKEHSRNDKSITAMPVLETCPDCKGKGYLLENEIPVHVVINPHGNPIPKAIKGGDWIDLRAAERVVMRTGDFRLISFGISMALPDGYEAHIAPRSSTFKNFGILFTNSVGVIDNSYNGDDDIWRIPALAMRDTIIEKGDRIAQFRLVKKQNPIIFNEVDNLGNSNRGGFGSTGTK